MNDDELLALVKRVDPGAVRLPPGIKAIAAEIQAVEREACARVVEHEYYKDCKAATAIRARSSASNERPASAGPLD